MKTRSAAWKNRRPASLFLGAAVMAMMLALSGCGGEATNEPAEPTPHGSQAKSPPSSGADTEGDAAQGKAKPSGRDAQPEEYGFIAELEKALNAADLDKLQKMMSEDLFSDIGEDVKRAREEGKTVQFKMVPLSVADGPGHRTVRVRDTIAVDGKIVETEELICHITMTDEGFYLKNAQASSADRPAKRPVAVRSGEGETEGPADIAFLERLENALNQADLDAMRAMLPEDVFRDLGREVQSAREKAETLKYELKPIAGDGGGTRSVLRVSASLTVDGDKQGPDELLFHFIKENGETRLEKVERADGERVGGDTTDGPDEGAASRDDGPASSPS